MSIYSRTIGSQVTNGMPAWRTAMTATNTLYEVGKRWDDATDGYRAKLVFPEATHGGLIYNGTDGFDAPLHAAYGGAVYVPELGAHGGMVFGGTGENIFQDQLGSWSISKDVPTWDVFQQPLYAQSAAEAAAMGASWYYNPTEYAALPEAKKMPWVASTAPAEADWMVTWDRTFPIGRAGWIIPGKCGISELGNNRASAFRYNTAVYIPASMTGWGAGAIVCNDRSHCGPFAATSGPPSQTVGGNPVPIPASEWYQDVWPVSGKRKFHLFAMNVVTKQWYVIATVPDFVNSYANAAMPLAAVDIPGKRIYYMAHYGGNEAMYYADFTNGAGAVTMGGPASLSFPLGGSGADISQSHSNADVFIGTTGALAGRKLYYYKNALNQLAMIDLSNNSLYRLNVSNPPPSGQWLFTVDQANARVFITVKNVYTNTVTSTSFAIPSDPTAPANYSLSTTDVAMNGITTEVTDYTWQYGSRGTLLTSLGGVILINQRQGKMLAYRPA